MTSSSHTVLLLHSALESGPFWRPETETPTSPRAAGRGPEPQGGLDLSAAACLGALHSSSPAPASLVVLGYGGHTQVMSPWEGRAVAWWQGHRGAPARTSALPWNPLVKTPTRVPVCVRPES